jgi:hypothetical protein
MAKKKPVKKAAKKPAKKPLKKAVVKKPAKKPVKKPAKKASAPPVIKAIRPKEAGLFLGEVEDFYQHISVIALTLKDKVSPGDTIRVHGHTTDFTQKVDSIQIDHKDVDAAVKGDSVGIKVIEKSRIGDRVLKLP